MEDFMEVLEQLYKKALLGATLERDNQDYVCYLQPAWPDREGPTASSSACSDTPGARGKCPQSPATSCPTWAAPVGSRSRARETALLQLTVVQVLVTRALSVETAFHANKSYREIITILLQSSDFDSKLTCMFQSSDKLLAHTAAKCLAVLLYFRLKEKITLSDSWIAFCQKNLSEYSEKEEVVYCLYTLTAVLKEILKDTRSQRTEMLQQFLTPFDATFAAFYDSLFSQHFENLPDTSKIVSSLIYFLELLELLIASRVLLGFHCPCQRIFFLKPLRVLHVITWPVQAFVRRKFLIFIKKCLLRKVGEDLCRGSVAALMPPDEHFDGDTSALADAALQAVDSGSLKTLPVLGRPSCFAGGEVPPGCECPPGPDHGILRAASLLVVKSLEIKFQNCASAKEMKDNSPVAAPQLLNFAKSSRALPVREDGETDTRSWKQATGANRFCRALCNGPQPASPACGALPHPPSPPQDLASLTQPCTKPRLPCWTCEAFPIGVQAFNLTLHVLATALWPLPRYSLTISQQAPSAKLFPTLSPAKSVLLSHSKHVTYAEHRRSSLSEDLITYGGRQVCRDLKSLTLTPHVLRASHCSECANGPHSNVGGQGVFRSLVYRWGD